MGNVIGESLRSAGKIAIIFVTTTLGHFAGQSFYEWFTEFREDRRARKEE